VSKILIREVTIDLPFLGRKNLTLAPRSAHDSYVTILIGRNGSGKSTLMRDMVVAMRGYYSGRRRARKGDSRIVHMKIEGDRHVDVLDEWLEGNLLNERNVIKDRNCGPKKIIALAFTPFDKFPAGGDDPRQKKNDPTSEVEAYVYLGFKSGLRSSPRALLRRSIDQLALASSSPTSDRRVADVFHALEYRPTLTIQYQKNRLERVLSSTQIDRENIESLLAKIESMLRPLPGRSGRGVSYRFDFLHGVGHSPNMLEFDTLRQLVRANVLQMTSATLERENGEMVELLDLSSGELSLLCGFLGLAAHLEDGCVVLIDEPENSLHPEWQQSYVEKLDAILKGRRGCHFILATHSPLIVSGFAGRDCTVLRLDQDPVEVEDEVIANSSPDATLISAFSVVTPDNNFLKQLVLEALALIEQGRHQEARAKEIAEFLATLHHRIPDRSLRELVQSVCMSILQR